MDDRAYPPAAQTQRRTPDARPLNMRLRAHHATWRSPLQQRRRS